MQYYAKNKKNMVNSKKAHMYVDKTNRQYVEGK